MKNAVGVSLTAFFLSFITLQPQPVIAGLTRNLRHPWDSFTPLSLLPKSSVSECSSHVIPTLVSAGKGIYGCVSVSHISKKGREVVFTTLLMSPIAQ